MRKCDRCGLFACWKGLLEQIPEDCPMALEKDVYQQARQQYEDNFIKKLAVESARTEAAGYCVWTRLEEIIEFSRRAGFERLGLAFCVGLRREANAISRFLEENGFEVFSVACKTGSFPKEILGLTEEEKVRPGQYEAMCNPVAQAGLLRKVQTDFNILLGLCVGHDTLFIETVAKPDDSRPPAAVR